MKEYTFSKITKLGEFDEKYGQRYWAEPNEQLEPIMFNSMNQNIKLGNKITAEEVLLKTSNKGVDYHGLKKVKVLGGGQVNLSEDSLAVSRMAAGMPSHPPISESQIYQILELVKEIHSATTKNAPEPGLGFDESGAPTDY